MFNNKKHIIIILIILSFIGSASLLFATKWGINTSPDSVSYILSACNFTEGKGFSVFSDDGNLEPMIHYPPLYPIILAIPIKCGLNHLVGARLINVFIFGINIFLIGFIICRYTNNSLVLSIFGSILMLSSFSMLNIHLMLWSEPIFILFAFTGLFFLGTYIENNKLSFLIISSFAIALAFLSRYIGITLVATGIIGIFILNKKKYRSRFIDAIIFTIISSFPMLLWFIRNKYVSGNITTASISFHPITFSNINSAVATFSMWLLPLNISIFAKNILWVVFIIMLSFSIVFIIIKRKYLIKQNTLPFLLLLGIFSFIYLSFLIFSISFIYDNIPLDNRILSPIYVSFVIIVLCAINTLWYFVNKVSKIALFVICIFFLLSCFFDGVNLIIDSHKDGWGYTSKMWRESEIIQKIKKIPTEVKIFSNAPDAIYILTGRVAYMLPMKVNPGNRSFNEDYPYKLSSLGEKLMNRKAVIVYFNTVSWRWYLPKEIELKERFDLKIMDKGKDGVIYAIEEIL